MPTVTVITETVAIHTVQTATAQPIVTAAISIVVTVLLLALGIVLTVLTVILLTVPIVMDASGCNQIVTAPVLTTVLQTQHHTTALQIQYHMRVTALVTALRLFVLNYTSSV